jgi:hypothetical protein
MESIEVLAPMWGGRPKVVPDTTHIGKGTVHIEDDCLRLCVHVSILLLREGAVKLNGKTDKGAMRRLLLDLPYGMVEGVTLTIGTLH